MFLNHIQVTSITTTRGQIKEEKIINFKKKTSKFEVFFVS